MKQRIRFDDGSIAEIEVPDGATDAQITAFVNQNRDAIQAQARPQLQQRETYKYEDPNRGNAFNALLRGATFDFADEAMGGIAATYAKMHDLITGKDSGVTYSDALESIRKDQEAFAERNPGTNLALEIAGGITTGGLGGMKVLGSQALKQTPKFVQRAAIPAVAGAEGFLYGAGQGENMEERMEKGVTQGMISAATAGLLDRVGQKFADKYLKREATALQQQMMPDKTPASIKKEAQDLFDKAESAGVAIKREHFDNWRAAFINDLRSEGISPEDISGLKPAFDMMNEIDIPTYNDLARIKKKLKFARGGADPDKRRAANVIAFGIDDFVNKLTPQNVYAGQVDDLASNINQAKDLWSRKRQLDVIEEIEEEVDLSAAVNLAGDLDSAVSAQIRPVMRRERKGRLQLDPEVSTSLKDIVKGSTPKKIARELAEIDPAQRTARGLYPTAAAATMGMLVTGSPAGLIAGIIPGVTGKVARRIVNKMTKNEIDTLKDAILNKNQPKIQEITDSIMEKYRPIISGAAASGSATTAEEQKTTLQDMMR